MLRALTRYFFKGLLFMVPIIGTIYIVYLIVSRIDRLYEFPFPGMGIAISVLVITLVGVIASHLLNRRVMSFIDMIFTRLPLVKMIYASIRDLTGAFVGEKKGFNQPVYVQLGPEPGAGVIGFMTREDLSHMGLDGMVSVYLPQSYNYSGYLIIVKRSQVRPIKAESGEVMSFLLSGGISGPKGPASDA